MNSDTLSSTISKVGEKWKNDPFFSSDSVVLGLDVGIEGIGIAIRKGTELLYCKTLMVDLPQPKPLAQRRRLRAARHARKNRHTRMYRLKLLFRRHNLPWVDDDVMSKSDPFLLRHRAIRPNGNGLSSKEALSICIRNCVEHRGYDYFALSRDAGDFPWGESSLLTDAIKWLKSAYVDQQERSKLLEFTPYLTAKKGAELDNKKVEEWKNLVEERAALADEMGIPAMLTRYARKQPGEKHKHIYERKARGFNYPRRHVENHLREILERHKHLIDNYEAFCAALFLPCDTLKNKKQAIFHFNRKTKEEAVSHFASKVKECPYCKWLGIPAAKCGLAGDLAARRWKMIDFLSSRTFDFCTKKKLPIGRYHLAPEIIQSLAEQIMQDPKCINKTYITALQKKIDPQRIFTTGDDWNDGQFKQLFDIINPSAGAAKKRGSFSTEAAIALYYLYTLEGTSFEPEKIEARKKDSGLYDFRQKINSGIGIYPQVRELLGTLRKTPAENESRFINVGFLQRLFSSPELKSALDGKTCPDYCVIECVRYGAANSEQAGKIKQRQDENRQRKEAQKLRYNRPNATHADFLRMRLFEEQGGFVSEKKVSEATCPFTGQSLGADPFSAELELAHLFPSARGGFYIADNLVLTRRSTNAAMGNRTPREAAAAGLPGWLSWDEMLNLSRKLGWGDMDSTKRYLFAFGSEDDEKFPEFENMTRTAQLAQDLRDTIAKWMEIDQNPEALRTRLSTPTGMHTAAARRAFLWENYSKDRSNNLHHRWDAACMTCLPPGAGLNDVRYGGIFYTPNGPNRRLQVIDNLPVPDFGAYHKAGDTESPVIKFFRKSKYQSLGDSTFWKVIKSDDPELNNHTSQRTPLVINKDLTVDKLFATLNRMGIPKHLCPSIKDIESWMLRQQPATKNDQPPVTPLRLKNGVPVKSIHKFDGKGSLDNNPIGWNGIINSQGSFDQLKNLSESNDCLEIWLGWNAKKKCWQFYKRVLPTAASLAGLKRMGIPWRGRRNAPEYLIKLLDDKKAPDLKTLICGTLPPHAVKVTQIRKGQKVLYSFSKAEKKKNKKNGKKEESPVTLDNLPIVTWGYVSSIKTSKIIKLTCLTHKERNTPEIGDVNKILNLIGIEIAPDTLASQMNLKKPL